MTLKDNLPKFIAEEKYTSEILDAIEPEIEGIKLKLSQILLECSISTCSVDGVKRFEEDYGIPYNSSLSLDTRRKNVINKMLAKKRLTKEELINFIKRNIDGSQFYISNEAEKYQFTVYLIDENYKEKLYQALFNSRPAHLIFNIKLTSYEKRCNTFRCNELTI